MGIYQGSKLMSGGGDGPSPYEIAQQNGYSGTEQEFNQLLAALDQNATKQDLDNKANLVNGKVPAEQLPTMDYATKEELSNKADLVGGKVRVDQLPTMDYAPAYTYGTEGLTAGTSALETGKMYIVYEP